MEVEEGVVLLPVAVLVPVVVEDVSPGTVIVETELTGNSADAPETTSWGTPPPATWEESMPVTVPVVAAAPLVPGIITVAPIMASAVARLWFCARTFVCCSVENWANWVIV